MSELRYTKEHEWIRVEGDVVVIGITDYAQQQLGDVVYVELPQVGRSVKPHDEAAVIESVKAASEVYAPLSGEITEVNETLSDAPETVNSDPTGDGWFMKLKLDDAGELDGLLDEAAYQSYIAGLD